MNVLLPHRLTLTLLLLAGGRVWAQSVDLHVAPPDPAAESARQAAVAAAPRVAERFGVAPLATLDAAAVAAPEQLAELQAWNRARRRPLQNGFVRSLAAPRTVDLSLPAASAPGTSGAAPSAPLVLARGGGVLAATSFTTAAWGARFRIVDAAGLRLHLAQVRLPAGWRLWVHGAGATAGPVGAELIARDGGLWTPGVAGEELAIDVEMPLAALSGGAPRTPTTVAAMAEVGAAVPPAAAPPGAGASPGGGGFEVGFVIDAALEIVPPAALAKDDISCEKDASCYSDADFAGYDTARHAVAELEFIEGRSGFLCTGQLLNDAASDGIPYVLTANHCISTQTVAATVVATFDDYTASCNGTAPDLSTLPSASGATLLATGSQANSSDFTLLRLARLPGGRTFLGWNGEQSAVPDGTLLYRISHAEGGPQRYSVSRIDSNSAICTNPLSRFIYSDLDVGAASPGSSGSAAMLANGQVVGQLLGGCGTSGISCDPLEHPLDGAFFYSFPAVEKFLAPSGGNGTCTPGSLDLCLTSRRFQVQVTWSNQFNGTSGTGHPILGTDSTGYFYFTDSTNYELVVKILDFGSVYKVFYGELTDLDFTITITDTHDGRVKVYHNTPGDCGAIDETAFPAVGPPPPGASAAEDARPFGPTIPVAAAVTEASCAPGSGTLCLLDRRFAVSVTWMNQFAGTSGTGRAKSLSDLSGLFTFTDPTDVELVLKVVSFSDRIAFYYAALSDFAYEITVTDTRSGTVKTYDNPAGTYCGGLDNNAFPP
jgi:hypothetical protein